MGVEDFSGFRWRGEGVKIAAANLRGVKEVEGVEAGLSPRGALELREERAVGEGEDLQFLPVENEVPCFAKSLRRDAVVKAALGLHGGFYEVTL